MTYLTYEELPEGIEPLLDTAINDIWGEKLVVDDILGDEVPEVIEPLLDTLGHGGVGEVAAGEETVVAGGLELVVKSLDR